MKDNHVELIDRGDTTKGKLNPLQTAWFGYSALYAYICIWRKAGTGILSHIEITDMAVGIMSVIALFFMVGVLCYNHKYEDHEGNKILCYLIAGLNLLGFFRYLVELIWPQ